jgi:hypothetical protein
MSSKARKTAKNFFVYKPKTFLVHPEINTLGYLLDEILSNFTPYDNHNTVFNAALPYQNMIIILKHPMTNKIIAKGRIWIHFNGKINSLSFNDYRLQLNIIDIKDRVNTANMLYQHIPTKIAIRIIPSLDTDTQRFVFFNPAYSIRSTQGRVMADAGIRKDFPIELYREPAPEEREEAMMNRNIARSEFNLRPGGPEYRLELARKNKEGNFLIESGVSSFRTRSEPIKRRSRSRSKSTSKSTSRSKSSRKSRLLKKVNKTLVTKSA